MRILVVGHDAERQGAPILMLRWLRSLQSMVSPAPEIDILVGRRGPLVRDYSRLGRVTVFDPLDGSRALPARVANRLLGVERRRRLWGRRVSWKLSRRAYDLIWANTVTGGVLTTSLRFGDVPRLLVLHEAEEGIRRLLSPRVRVQDLGDRFVTVSCAMRDTLTRLHDIPPDRISVVKGILDEDWAPPTRSDARRRLGVSPEEFVVLGCGRGVKEKGFDLAPPVVRALSEMLVGEPFQLIWVGLVEITVEALLRRDLAATRAGDHLKLVGEVEAPVDWFAAADVLWLPSEFESFSLAMIEAASCGVPTVACRGIGGPDEFINGRTGVLTSSRDPATMASALVRLMRNPELLRQLGAGARERALARHVAACQVPRLVEAVTGAASLHRTLC